MKKQPAADGLKKRVLLVWWQYMYASVLGAAVRQRAVSHAMTVWIGATDVSGVFSCAALALVELRSHKCLSWCFFTVLSGLSVLSDPTVAAAPTLYTRCTICHS